MWYDRAYRHPRLRQKHARLPHRHMGRVNRPALMIYGGTIKPGHSKDGKVLDIISMVPELRRIHRRQARRTARQDIVQHACPGAGFCGGMYTTATTMAAAIEALGMSLPYSSSTPAMDR